MPLLLPQVDGMKRLLRLRAVPLWAGVVAIAVVVFIALFCSLLPLSGNDGGLLQEEKTVGYQERFYEPLGSDIHWLDTECYPWTGYLSLHLYRVSSGEESFAYSKNGSGVSPPILNGQGESVTRKWTWAFAVGGAAQFYHYDWNVCATYQYFNDNQTQSVAGDDAGTLIPLRSVALNGRSVTNAISAAAFTLNELDVSLTKQFHFHENLLIQAILGLRNTWIKNNQSSSYTGGATLGNNFVNVRQNNDYWGIGPLGGVVTKWLIFDNFYFLGAGDISLECIANRSSYAETQNNNSNAAINLFEKMQYLAPTIDCKIGVGVADYICKNKTHLSCDFTYDAQFFSSRSNAFEIEPYATVRYMRPTNNVTLQGFAISLTALY